MNPERYVAEEARESKHPFKQELETLQEGEDFDIHKFGKPREIVELPAGEERDFDEPQHAVTEYFDESGKNHEEFVKLKKFYEAAQIELGDLLPHAMFVEGEPSDPSRGGRSFYVVQKFDNQDFNDRAKGLQELNRDEFSVEYMNQLLEIQSRLYDFIERYGEDLPADWIDVGSFDPKGFKENVLHVPGTSETKIANMFRMNPELTKQITGNEEKFEPAKDRLKLLKMIGLAGLMEKIQWSLEKSGWKDLVLHNQGKARWWMDAEKMKKYKEDGKEVMALTFDDGPNDETEKLLDILKEEGVKATFFLVGSMIAGREHIVKRIIDDGHDVGVHEWDQEGAKPNAGIKEYAKRFVGPREDLGDVKKTTELIQQITGVKPEMGRVAGVHGTVDSVREFEAMGLKLIHGNPYDVLFMPPKTNLNADNLLKKAVSSNGHGRIRIFHIGTMTDQGMPLQRSEINFDKGEVYPPEETLKMIREYIEKSRDQGYDFVQVKDNI